MGADCHKANLPPPIACISLLQVPASTSAQSSTRPALEGEKILAPFCWISRIVSPCHPQKNVSIFFFFFFFKIGSRYVAVAGLELMILLPQPPECWDYRCVPLSPLHLFFAVLGY
jgi:hypothetical protein